MRITPYGAAKRPNHSRTRWCDFRRKACAAMAPEPSVAITVPTIRKNTSLPKSIPGLSENSTSVQLWAFQDLIQGVGEDEIVKIDRVDRGTVRTAMNPRLAEINVLGAFRLQFPVQHRSAVEP